MSGSDDSSDPLRLVEYTMLVLVNENPGSTAAHLPRVLAVSARNIAMWLENVQGRGLVRREASQTDRRSQHLYVTDKGRKLAEEVTRRVVEAERHVFSHLSIPTNKMAMDFPFRECVDEIRNPIVALVAVRRKAASSGRGSPFHR